MGRINTNIQSLITQRVLGANNATLAQSLERLSTGFRVNRGKDDPAGLIASEALRVEQKGLNAAISNAERADQVSNIAEGSLQEVSSLLTELQGMLTETASRAGLSSQERSANQLQIDSILQTIERISSSANFQGTKLLNGNLDFRVSSVASGISDYRVGAARYNSATLGVDVLVTASAQQGGIFLSFGATSLDLTTGSSLVLDIGGTRGSRELSFASGTSLAKIRDAINAFSDVTGLTAAVSGTGIRLATTEFGSSEFVSVRTVNAAGIASGSSGIHRLRAGNFAAAATNGTDGAGSETEFSGATNGVRDQGQDIGAIINGVVATGKGRTARVSSDALDAEVTLTSARAQQLGSVGGSSSSFTIVGGGAEFHLGQRVDIGGRLTIGVPAVSTRTLGNATVGYLDRLGSGKANNAVNGDLNGAQKIVAEAISQVSAVRGRLGTFQKNIVGATIRSLGVAVENTAAANSVIRDADFATETAQLTRSQILVSASINVMQLANNAPQSALQLLG
ncbi:MAG: flagellin [Phycisphaerae bacterium]|nr:flagellin [Phycisphaerae bacterium]